MARRPSSLAVVAGTGTGVGKTWVSAAWLARRRARGELVAARKPVQSYDPASDEPTDAEVLAAATGEEPTAVCGEAWSYPVPLAPFMAAEILGREPVDLAAAVDAVTWPAGVQFGLVESVGGVRSPIAEDGTDTLRLVGLVAPDLVVLVAPSGLGALHDIRAATDALMSCGRPVTVLLNRFDPADDLHRRNRRWLDGRLDVPVVVGVGELSPA